MTKIKRPGEDDPRAQNKKPSKNKYTPPNPNDEPSRSAIWIERGELAGVVRDSAAVLRSAGGIYQWSDRLVRLARVRDEDAAPEAPIRRDAAMRMLFAIAPGWMALRLSDAAVYYRWDARAGDWRPTDPPQRVASVLVEAGDELGFPVLSARAACPQILPDGRIQGHGYHPDTELLIDAPGAWPAPPEAPSRRAAEQALGRLRDLYRYYPWATPDAESAALAALITACIRPTLDCSPGFGVTAPLSGAGTGKGLLVRSIAVVATGCGPTLINWSGTPGEGAKRLDATHLAGDLVISIDNVTRPLDDEALCSALTEPTRDIRELGSSKTSRTPMRAVHFVTGNALTIRGDLTRRMVPIALDAGTDAADQREIPQDLIAECRTGRREIVRDVHTVLRAYLAAGEPERRLRPMGGYRQWTRRVRAPLVWLGLPDPASTQEALRVDDPERESRVALFRAWYAAFGSEGSTAREAIELVSDAFPRLPAETVDALRDALEAVATRRGRLDALALGNYLKSARGARVEDLVLMGVEARSNRVRWVVARHGEAMSRR